MPGPTFLDGDRVTLRVPDESDVDFLLDHENDPDVRATRSVTAPSGPDDVRRRLGGTLGRRDDTLALVVFADGDRVGQVYLIREKPNDATYRRAELAYWVAPAAQGNGYATDAARTVLGHGVDRLGLHKVTAKSFASNEASVRVLEKLGFEREGVFREEAYVDGEFVDLLRFGLLAEEWRA
ncbi:MULTISPECIES: GNAT family N-acetyltransferase [Halorussus]|uniref:GNAT family N-acetyltransferase n=1 Tax=Halorussus TaxID=1070314 RepID=UPI000E214A38|nr:MULTISPECIES: GNAT family protein [Halorussus]NHN59792.1 GNAT family N-acetyltransferase [Halorussus sp. JP-T4]